MFVFVPPPGYLPDTLLFSLVEKVASSCIFLWYQTNGRAIMLAKKATFPFCRGPPCIGACIHAGGLFPRRARKLRMVWWWRFLEQLGRQHQQLFRRESTVMWFHSSHLARTLSVLGKLKVVAAFEAEKPRQLQG
jgi:hypothetical protein